MSKERGQANILWNSEIGVYVVTFPYFGNKTIFQEYVDLIKKAIPSHQREWQPINKRWLIHENCFAIIKILLEAKFRDVKIHTKEEIEELRKEFNQHNYAPKVPNREAVKMRLAELLNISIQKLDDIKDIDEIKKEYRQASLKYHPDRNAGDGKRMAELNMYYADLKELLRLEHENANTAT